MFASMFFPKIFARADDDGDQPATDPNSSPHNAENGVVENDGTAKTLDVALTTSNTSAETQAGVREIEAVTQVWTKGNMIAAYVFIWILKFLDAMFSGAISSFNPYVTSAFLEHELTATTDVFSSLIAGLIQLPLAKVLDICGRSSGFISCTIVMVIGLIMMAFCQNVETYAAAQVFYSVGFSGIYYCVTVFIADTSSLKNRAFAYAWMNSPFIITAWIGGPIAASFLDGAGWRWGFGTFAIVGAVASCPIVFLFAWSHRKAKRMGVLQPRQPSGRSFLQNVKHYCLEFDFFGIFLAAAGLALFLLPFNIYSKQDEGWRSPMIICMLVFGIVLLVLFALYERYLAPVQFIPFHVLVDRSVMGSSIVIVLIFIAWSIWNSFFSSFLQVVTGLSVVEASYVGNIYNLVACFWGLIVGVLIRWTGRYKWLALYFAAPLNILGVGLLIYVRQPQSGVGAIIGSQILVSLAGGTLVICDEMAAMAAVKHQHIAVVLALHLMFSSIGGAIGSSVSAAIWTSVFPQQIINNLPPETQDQALTIIGSMEEQLNYPFGDATRTVIVEAYVEAQKIMLISATSFLVVSVFAIAVWRDLPVKNVKRKGVVV